MQKNNQLYFAAITGFLLMLVLSGCLNTGNRFSLIDKVNMYPGLILDDRHIACWNIADKTIALGILSDGKLHHVGNYPDLGFWKRPVNETSFLTVNVRKEQVGSKNRYICSTYIYQLKSRSRRLLMDDASVSRISYPVSSDGRKCLLSKGHPHGGWKLQTIDRQNNKVETLLENFFTYDAVWTDNGKAVLAYGSIKVPNKPEIWLLYRILVSEPSNIRILRKDSEFKAFHCSPDGQHVAYEKDGTLFLEEITSGQIKVLASGLGTGVSIIWSRDGKCLAAVSDDPKIRAVCFFQIDENILKQVRLPRKGSIMPLGWLDSKPTFLINRVPRLDSCTAEVWAVTPFEGN